MYASSRYVIELIVPLLWDTYHLSQAVSRLAGVSNSLVLFNSRGDFTHLDSPNSCPSPYIQDTLRIFWYRRQVQLPPKCDLRQLMHDVQPIALFLP